MIYGEAAGTAPTGAAHDEPEGQDNAPFDLSSSTSSVPAWKQRLLARKNVQFDPVDAPRHVASSLAMHTPSGPTECIIDVQVRRGGTAAAEFEYLPAPREVEGMQREIDRLLAYFHVAASDRDAAVEQAKAEVAQKHDEQLRALREEHARQQETAAIEHTRLVEETEKLGAELQLARDASFRAQQLERQLDAARHKSADSERGLVSLTQEKQSENDRLRVRVSELEGENSKLVTMLSALEDELSKLAEHMDRTQANERETEGYLQQEAVISEQTNQISALNEELARMERVNRALQLQLEAGYRNAAIVSARYQDEIARLTQGHEQNLSSSKEVMESMKEQLVSANTGTYQAFAAGTEALMHRWTGDVESPGRASRTPTR